MKSTWNRPIVGRLVLRYASVTLAALAMLVMATSGPSLARAIAQVQESFIPHDSGQNVTPAYEGWYKNADGTYSLVFGYMNRNFKEVLDVPIGPNNRFSPGPEDRGQPTHFMTRRHWGVFAISVPPEVFADKNYQLTWTLTTNGKTDAIPGHFRPEWEIDALKEITSGNTPPVIKFAPTGETAQGPRGVFTDITVTYPAPAKLAVWVSDDGIKKAGQSSRTTGAAPLGVGWSKYRGPGTVTFAAADPPVENGTATTTATFSAPGEYTLRLHAWDDSGRYAGGFYCCWTNGYARVTVRPGTSTQ